MRTALILFLAGALGCVFLYQKQREQKPEPATAAAGQTATPRPVSEHNWGKRALDTTAKVTRDVAKKRQEDGNR
jgi:hypothetical protein